MRRPERRGWPFRRDIIRAPGDAKAYSRAVDRAIAHMTPGELVRFAGYFSCYAAKLGATVIAIEIQRSLCNATAANAAVRSDGPRWRA
jgi:hypothetical protein